ncbi:MAG: ribonucleoside triphosphate reductase [Candidatus Cloacimonetes bacterium]|jgi:ribonucleoside-triphosphate reductase|nr:ribonucleoside triphosphate reductase [Candidatus Cloacimonadota bacterium]MDD2422738.1 ribonucleoside triphosphate reductase [Candidatus Cloacimonadota bacterium]MDD3563659.1 ribonucleoside triphosphate reductase [Candidatus Cloacimonadota bacterium]MDD4277728.1 ribonucleoside triphosphate reductase [Candidatus Cloacimonadota bacterium]MDY0324558.1 ribonucleoside triphosphate reductase [Candidatus Cloacimonadaceae bacterium]
MFSLIRKRNGHIVDFDQSKITRAIEKAASASGEFDYEMAEKLCLRVINLALQTISEDTPDVEKIQDLVEEVLLASPYKQTAKAFIIYRDQHARMREMVSKAGVKLIDQYLDKLDWQVNENSNMAYSLQGLNNYIASEVSKTYWLNKIYPPEIREAHVSGDLHIHDLGQLSVYCVGWDLMDLLQTGFCGAEGKVESAPAKHFRSALGQIVNFFYTLQGEAAGAQAFSSFDTLLAPFIYYDHLNYQEVKQALQEFVFNINVPTRVGFQTPFTNITIDLFPPKLYKDQPVIIGGKPQDKCYADFQAEMDMLNKAFLEVMIEGDAKGRVFTFPIPTYNITKDFDWENPAIAYLWEATAKYGIPYFSNFVNSDMDPNDARSMCCRLRLDTRKLQTRGGGLFGANPLTGSIGVVTLNLPRVGYLAETEEDFFARIERILNLAMSSLEIKRKVLERYTNSGLYPYTRFYLKSVKSRFDKFWENHFSTIGIIGMNEACENFLGVNVGSQKGRDFALKVMDYLRARLIEFQALTHNNYNLEATPAEGTSYRLALLDRQSYPGIKSANGKEETPFYTNSSQLPVNFSDDVFEVLDLQDELQTKYTGGTVLHIFGGERLEHSESVKNLVKSVCSNYRLPYFTFSPTFSICPEHGYLVGEQALCPSCKKNCEIFSRIVGYLRPVSQWNEGKQAEFKLRTTFDTKKEYHQSKHQDLSLA